MADLVKVGLIGPGRGKNGFGIGHYIAREVINNNSSELVSILGRNKKRVGESISIINEMVTNADRFYGNIYSSRNANSFFRNDDMQLIIICSPPETHYNFIKKCLENKKNVLVEKPLIKFRPKKSDTKSYLVKDLFNIANSLNLFISTNCQRAAIVHSLKVLFGAISNPQHVLIDLSIPANVNLLTPYQLCELLLAHPISILVKFGLSDHEMLRLNQLVKVRNDANSVSLELVGSFKNIFSGKTYFHIKLNQSVKITLTTMKLKIDNNSFTIMPKKCPDGTFKISIQNQDFKIFEIDDFLKTSISRTIEAITQNDPRKLLINNDESQLIHLVQENILYNVNFSNNE